jgi:hypothetical protein
MRITQKLIGRPCKFCANDGTDYYGRIMNVKRTAGTTWVTIWYTIPGRQGEFTEYMQRSEFNRLEIY